MSTVTSVTDATFRAEVLDSELPVVVDIWATWCGPCKAIAPILDQLASEYAGRVKIVKVDADQNPETVTAASVTSIPTLGFYLNGERVDVLIGAIVAGRLFNMPHSSKIGIISVVVVFVAAIGYLILPGMLAALLGSGCIG